MRDPPRPPQVLAPLTHGFDLWPLSIYERVTCRAKDDGTRRSETCTLTTSEMLIRRPRTRVEPQWCYSGLPGFTVLWVWRNRETLYLVHRALADVLQRVGFTAAATAYACEFLYGQRDAVANFWREHLGENFRHYYGCTGATYWQIPGEL